MKFILKALFLITSIGLFQSCTPTEGEGGTSSVTGKVFVKDYDADGDLKDTYYPGEWTVYIIYGEEKVYSDKMDTHYDGSFKFSSLYPGNYTVYTYSKCPTCPGGKEVKEVKFSLDRNEAKTLDDIVVLD